MGIWDRLAGESPGAAENSAMPRGRWGRLLKVLNWSSGIASEQYAIALRLADGEDAEDASRRFQERSVASLVDLLSELRGLPLKLFALPRVAAALAPRHLSYVLESRLSPLPEARGARPWRELERVLREELGSDVLKSLGVVDPTPLGQGSLSQVHKASLRSGEEVAVKVLLPGIEEVVSSDLSLARIAGRAARAWLPLGDVDHWLDEAARRSAEELDLGCELCNLEEMAGLWEGDRGLELARPVPEFCSRQVLTTRLQPGLKASDCERASAEARGRAAEAMTRYVLGSAVKGLIPALFHSGDWVLREDGGLGVFDLGQLARLEDEGSRALRAVYDAVRAQDFEALKLGTGALLQVEPGEALEEWSVLTRVALEPFLLQDSELGLDSALDEVALGRVVDAASRLLGALLPRWRRGQSWGPRRPETWALIRALAGLWDSVLMLRRRPSAKAFWSWLERS